MLKSKEFAHIILAIVILIFVVNFINIIENNLSIETFTIKSFGIALIVFTSIFAKKLAAYYFEASADFKIWQLQRFGFKPNQKLKKPIPAGIIIPFVISFLSAGYALWLAVLEFDIRVHPSRASKRHEHYKFSNMTDIHLAFITGAGVITCLILSILAYLGNFPEITKLAIYYAVWNLIPISNLDGSKIFFGSRILWYILAIVTGIFLAYALFLP